MQKHILYLPLIQDSYLDLVTVLDEVKKSDAGFRAIHLPFKGVIIQKKQFSREELYREANRLLRQAGFFRDKSLRQTRFERRMRPIGSIGLPKRGRLVYKK